MASEFTDFFEAEAMVLWAHLGYKSFLGTLSHSSSCGLCTQAEGVALCVLCEGGTDMLFIY